MKEEFGIYKGESSGEVELATGIDTSEVQMTDVNLGTSTLFG